MSPDENDKSRSSRESWARSYPNVEDAGLGWILVALEDLAGFAEYKGQIAIRDRLLETLDFIAEELTRTEYGGRRQ